MNTDGGGRTEIRNEFDAPRTTSGAKKNKMILAALSPSIIFKWHSTLEAPLCEFLAGFIILSGVPFERRAVFCPPFVARGM